MRMFSWSGDVDVANSNVGGPDEGTSTKTYAVNIIEGIDADIDSGKNGFRKTKGGIIIIDYRTVNEFYSEFIYYKKEEDVVFYRGDI